MYADLKAYINSHYNIALTRVLFYGFQWNRLWGIYLTEKTNKQNPPKHSWTTRKNRRGNGQTRGGCPAKQSQRQPLSSPLRCSESSRGRSVAALGHPRLPQLVVFLAPASGSGSQADPAGLGLELLRYKARAGRAGPGPEPRSRVGTASLSRPSSAPRLTLRRPASSAPYSSPSCRPGRLRRLLPRPRRLSSEPPPPPSRRPYCLRSKGAVQEPEAEPPHRP